MSYLSILKRFEDAETDNLPMPFAYAIEKKQEWAVLLVQATLFSA